MLINLTSFGLLRTTAQLCTWTGSGVPGLTACALVAHPQPPSPIPTPEEPGGRGGPLGKVFQGTFLVTDVRHSPSGHSRTASLCVFLIINWEWILDTVSFDSDPGWRPVLVWRRPSPQRRAAGGPGRMGEQQVRRQVRRQAGLVLWINEPSHHW